MKTVRTHLLLAIVPLALVPLLISTAMSVGMTWTNGCEAIGWGWTAQAVSSLPELLKMGGSLAHARLALLKDQQVAGKHLEPSANELLLVLDDKGAVVAKAAGKELASLATQDLANITVGDDWDLAVVATHLFFVVGQADGADRYLLFKELDDDYVDSLHGVTGTEITLYLGQVAVRSTWADQTGKRVLIPMSPEMAAKVAATPESASSLQVKAVMPIENYHRVHRSELTSSNVVSNFEAYHTLMRLKNKAGQTLGLVGASIPQDVAFDGVRNAIVGSTVLFGLLTMISLLVVRQVATVYARPIVKLAQDMDQLLGKISNRLPGKELDEGPVLVSSQPRELSLLERSFHRLNSAFKAWHETETQLNDSRRQLMHAAKMSALGEMAGGVAHEINNPLTIVLSRSVHIGKVLALEPPNLEKATQFAKLIETTAERIAEIVKGLRTFSRSGDSDPFEVCDLKAVLHDTLSLCTERFKLNGVQLQIEEPWEGATFEGRAVQISQVLLNLLGNAYDAVQGLPQKWVKISFFELGPMIQITICDSGTGIPEAVRTRLMEPFFTTKPVGKGTGLGLSVSKAIVEEHHGTLTIEATAPNTTFIIMLPKVDPTKDLNAA